MFKLLKYLGEIKVPPNYQHETAIARFASEQGKKFNEINPEINDANFPNPSRILKAGDVLYVSVWEQAVAGTKTSKTERMDFLRSEDAVFTGVQGLILTSVQKSESLPKGRWCSSMDEPDRLLNVADGEHNMPLVILLEDNFIGLFLGSFETDWDDTLALLLFRDKPLEF